jgi:hypothetical protein
VRCAAAAAQSADAAAKQSSAAAPPRSREARSRSGMARSAHAQQHRPDRMALRAGGRQPAHLEALN